MAAYQENAGGITYQAVPPGPEVQAYWTIEPMPREAMDRTPMPAAAAASDDKSLDPAANTDNSQIHPTSKQLKEEEEAKKEKENGVQKLKSSLLVTGVVVAVIGAIFAVVKNIKKA